MLFFVYGYISFIMIWELCFVFFFCKCRYKVCYQRHSTKSGTVHREMVSLVKMEGQGRDIHPERKAVGVPPSEEELRIIFKLISLVLSMLLLLSHFSRVRLCATP